MSDIHSGPDVWRIHGQATYNYLPTIDGDSAGLTATLLWGETNFVRYPGGARKDDLVVGCRTDVTFTMTPH